MVIEDYVPEEIAFSCEVDGNKALRIASYEASNRRLIDESILILHPNDQDKALFVDVNHLGGGASTEEMTLDTFIGGTAFAMLEEPMDGTPREALEKMAAAMYSFICAARPQYKALCEKYWGHFLGLRDTYPLPEPRPVPVGPSMSELARRARNGDEAARKELTERYGEDVVRKVLKVPTNQN